MVKLTIPGQPVAAGRPRFSRGRVYMPRPNAEYMDRTQAAWMVEGRPSFSPDERLTVHVNYYMARPKSQVKADGSPRKGAPERPLGPDLDNLMKLTLDGLNGYLWKDDAQVCCLSGMRMFARAGEEPRTELQVWSSGPR